MKPDSPPAQQAVTGESKAWQRYVKRHGTSQQWQFLALASPALHPTLQQELADLGFGDLQPQENGICFRGQLPELYRAHLHLRSCSRLFLCLEFRAASLEELHRKAQNLPWELFLPGTKREKWETAELPFQILCHTRNSRVSLPVLASRSLSKAIVRRLQAQRRRFAPQVGPVVLPEADDMATQRIHLFIEGYRAQLRIDASGIGLHQHGYRQQSGKAALREDLAAGLISRMLQLRGSEAPELRLILDGMCGSGTLLSEAFLARNGFPCRPPMAYAFCAWPMRRADTWRYLCQKTKEGARSASALAQASGQAGCHFLGLDCDVEQLACARHNAQRLAQFWPEAEGGQGLAFRQGDFFQYPAPEEPEKTLLLLNPPYGQRLGPVARSQQIYSQLADCLQQQYTGASILILLPEKLQRHWQQQMRRPATEVIRLRHGGLWVLAYLYVAASFHKAVQATECNEKV